MRRDIDDEISFHIESRIEMLRAGGMSEAAAREEAAKRFGSEEDVARELERAALRSHTERRRAELLSDAWRDVRHTTRALLRSPGYSLAVIITLALGIGANTAVFSVVRGVLLRPLPYAVPDELQIINTKMPGLGLDRANLSLAELHDLQQRAPAFVSVGVFGRDRRTLIAQCGGSACEPERVETFTMTAGAFDALATPAALGRVYREDENWKGRDDVIVLSDGFWRRRFGARHGIVGEKVVVDGTPRTVIGVMPPGFEFGRADAYMPPGDPLDSIPLRRGWHSYVGIARRAPGVTAAAAERQVSAVAAQLRREYPDRYPEQMGFGLTARSLEEYTVGRVRSTLLVLFAAVSLVLLIACVNVANLSLARAENRQREFAVRAALGAGRGRIWGQVLLESTLLSGAGAVIGVGIAAACTRGLLAVNPDAIPRAQHVQLDSGVLLFTLAVAASVGFAFGLFPAVHVARSNVHGMLRDDSRSSTAGAHRTRARRLLVAAEVALALMILSSGAVVLRSFWRLQKADLGFASDHILALHLALPIPVYNDSSKPPRFIAQITERLATIPGVTQVASATALPLTGASNWDIELEDQPLAPGDAAPSPNIQIVTPGYHSILDIPVLKGRALTHDDNTHAAMNVVVNRAMAQRYWPAGALGKRFRVRSRDPVLPWLTIVGVVGDVRMNSPREEPRPEWQITLGSIELSHWLLVRAGGDVGSLTAAARRELRALDANLTWSDVKTLDSVVRSSLARDRFATLLLSCFAVLALLLAAVGVYGVVAYTVARRTREFGVRVALGATRGDLTRLVVGDGMRAVALGLVIGIVGALASARIVQSLLFDTSARDPRIIGAIALLLTGVAAAATLVPAWRASHIDPARTLRDA